MWFSQLVLRGEPHHTIWHTPQLFLKRSLAAETFRRAVTLLGVLRMPQTHQGARRMDRLELLPSDFMSTEINPLNILYTRPPHYLLFNAFTLYVNCGIMVRSVMSSIFLVFCFLFPSPQWKKKKKIAEFNIAKYPNN